jgi:hypothetical protein
LDKIGLVAKINKSVLSIYQGRLWLDTDGLEHEGRISYNAGLSRASESFTEALSGVEEDLETLVLAELNFLTQELHSCGASDTNAVESLTNAIQSFDEALSALKELQAGPSYRVIDRALPHRKECRCNGMPKDSFHWACEGHKMRIRNTLKAPGINLTEKALLKQRNANVLAAQSVYLQKQKKVIAERNG